MFEEVLMIFTLFFNVFKTSKNIFVACIKNKLFEKQNNYFKFKTLF